MSLSSFYLVLKRSILELLECPAQLVRTRCTLGSTTYSVNLWDYIVNLLSTHQLTDTLQVSITATKEEHLLNHIVLIGSHVNEL